MEIQFKTKNDNQLLAAQYWLDDTTEEILFGGGKGGGKSYLGCSLIFGDALIYPETHYFIARQELIDLRKYTIPSIHEVFKNWHLKIEDYATYNGQDNVFNLSNGSKVYLIACKEIPSDPMFERFGSMQMTKGWIEEGGEISESAKSNLWLSIGRWKNEEYGLKKKLLITANPKKGWMKRDFIDPYKQGLLPPSRQFVKSLATDNPYLPKDYIDTLSNEKNLVRRQRLFEGDWDYDEDKDSLITYDALADTFTNTIVKDGQKYLTVDVARLGRDSTVMSFWEGLELYKIEKYQKQDTDATKQKIKDFAATEKIPYSNILIDEDGIGGAVVDGLFGVKGFIANTSPLPTANEIRMKLIKSEINARPNFKNLKAQCGFKLAEMINERKLAIRTGEYRDDIIEELTAILRQKNFDKEGKMQLIPKDEVKTAISRSPDVGDTILMRMLFELQRELKGSHNEAVVVEKQINLFKRNINNTQINSTL
jgi:phage terminase large subunit